MRLQGAAALPLYFFKLPKHGFLCPSLIMLQCCKSSSPTSKNLSATFCAQDLHSTFSAHSLRKSLSTSYRLNFLRCFYASCGFLCACCLCKLRFAKLLLWASSQPMLLCVSALHKLLRATFSALQVALYKFWGASLSTQATRCQNPSTHSITPIRANGRADK